MRQGTSNDATKFVFPYAIYCCANNLPFRTTCLHSKAPLNKAKFSLTGDY